MQSIFDDEEAIFNVVINHEEQYSIWPEYKEIPAGWKAVGTTGKKAECLAYIEEVWKDMRPLSLRKKMEEAARKKEN
jgi:MbtH protein